MIDTAVPTPPFTCPMYHKPGNAKTIHNTFPFSTDLIHTTPLHTGPQNATTTITSYPPTFSPQPSTDHTANMDALGLSELRHLKPRQLLSQVLNFALILSTAFMLWKGLSVATDSPSPIVVVLSGSMEPAFQRGDLLFLWNRNLELDSPPTPGTQVGEIVVYNVIGKDIPIVHRVVRKHQGPKTPLHLLTKGDNNHADDTELYARGRWYLDREKEVIGSVVGYVPFVGYVTIMLSEHPWMKTALLGIMGLLVIVQRE